MNWFVQVTLGVQADLNAYLCSGESAEHKASNYQVTPKAEARNVAAALRGWVRRIEICTEAFDEAVLNCLGRT